jgi:hypothetical protein
VHNKEEKRGVSKKKVKKKKKRKDGEMVVGLCGKNNMMTTTF